jgi:hypothetical protein
LNPKEEAWKAHAEAKKRYRKASVNGDQKKAEQWWKKADELWKLIGGMR